MYDVVSLLEEHGQADMLLEELVAFEVITSMQLGRIFRGTHVKAHHTFYMRVPEWHSGENIEGYR